MLSIVTPALNEADNLPLFVERLTSALAIVGADYEIIVVDDGSTDNTRIILQQLAARNQRVRAVFLTRNFGHQAALSAGLDNASGEAVVFIDADLQQPPELVGKMYELFKTGVEVVLCRREHSTGRLELASKLSGYFYALMRHISAIPIEKDVADFMLLSRPAADFLKNLPERDRFIRGLVQWSGYKSSILTYRVAQRNFGSSKYTWRKRIEFAWSGVTSFSAAPLRLSFFLSLFTFTFCVLFILYVLADYFFITKNIPSGWATTIIIISLLGALQFLVIGVIGEYIARLFYEMKGRPIYVVSHKLGFGKNFKPNKSDDAFGDLDAK